MLNSNFLIDFYHFVGHLYLAAEKVVEHRLDLTVIKLFGARIMADSEDSRTLSKIMQRHTLAEAAGAHPDTSITLWSKWFTLHQRRQALSVRQRQIESRLLAAVRSAPVAELTAAGDQFSSLAATDEEVDALLPGEDRADARSCANAQLEASRMEWDVADEQLGYSRAHQEELDVMQAELEAAQCLWMAPARTIAGVAAKLHALIEWEDPGTQPGESPWPELRSILGDLIEIGDLHASALASTA